MLSTNVRRIKAAINDQTMRGTRQVHVNGHQRVIDAKIERGQLKIRLLNDSGKWLAVDAVHID